jgi:hypothetical protein
MVEKTLKYFNRKTYIFGLATMDILPFFGFNSLLTHLEKKCYGTKVVARVKLHQITYDSKIFYDENPWYPSLRH